MGPAAVDEKLFSEYNKGNRYWRVFYYDYELFKSQYNASVEWILSKLRKVNIIVENREKELIIKLKNGDVDERIKACEILGDMGSEELLHEKSIKVLKNICKADKIFEVKKAAENALNLINKLVLTYEEKVNIKERDEYKCLCCGEDEKSFLQVDHIKPQYFKVDNSVDNLQTLCKICNIIKSTDSIDFRKTLTNTEKQPFEFLGINKIHSLEQWEVRNSKNWKKFLQRYINFFYKCAAVESIQIDKNEQNWKIKLHEGNNTSWLTSFIEDLTINIQSIRKEYGYSGPKELEIESGIIEKPEHVECLELINILKKGSDYSRARAATRLGTLNCKKSVSPLIKALKDPDRFVPTHAAASLGKIADLRAINPLIQMFRGSHGEVAMGSIVKIGKPAVQELIYYVTNFDVHVRRLSIDALGKIKDDSAVESLINSLNDKDSTVRWRAARALGNIGNQKAIEFLSNLENDVDEKVREEIRKALKKFKNPMEILLDIFNERIKEIDDKIAIKTIKDGFYYYTPEKVFLKAYLDNSEKVEFVTYVGNNDILGVKNLKYTPEWGFFFLTKEKENFQKALKIVKTSFEMIPNFVKKYKKDKPGTYETNELKLKLENYLSKKEKTPMRIKNIVLPLCLEYDIVTREMIKEKLVSDGEATNKGQAGVILTSISGAFGREDYLRQIITYERPYTWERDNYSLVAEYRGIIKELIEKFESINYS